LALQRGNAATQTGWRDSSGGEPGFAQMFTQWESQFFERD
jgi:hypothetical protein